MGNGLGLVTSVNGLSYTTIGLEKPHEKENIYMATSLLKLVMTASQPTTKAKPSVTNFFNTVPVGGYTGTTIEINDVNWVDDTGTPVIAAGLVTAATDNGYYTLFINGQMQEASVIGVTTTKVTLTFASSVTIDAGKVIALAVTNFAPDTTAPVITG